MAKHNNQTPNNTNRSEAMAVYYDGNCPFCQWEIDLLSDHDKEDALKLVDISAPGFNAVETGKSLEQLMAKMHVQTSDGEEFTATEAFRATYQAVGLGRYNAWTGWPVFRPVMDVAYWLFARVRVPIGDTYKRLRAYQQSLSSKG